jgi:carbonic anhydrase
VKAAKALQRGVIGLISVTSLGVNVQAEPPLLDLAAEFEQLNPGKSAPPPAPSIPKRPASSTNTLPTQPSQPTQSSSRFYSDQQVDKSGEVIPSESATKPSATRTKPAWDYSQENGPEAWHQLASEYQLCGKGKHQSPIDLRDKQAIGTQGLADIDIRYRDVPMKILHSEHQLQVKYPLGSFIQIGEQKYPLQHYQIKTPSEHRKEGFNYPMEVQMVHKDGDDRYVIISVLFEEGEFHPYLDLLIQRLPSQKNKLVIDEKYGLNPVYFLPGETKFYQYSGSMTTPPCQEGVSWIVFKQPIQASVSQINRIRKFLGENARPVQPINVRPVLKSWSEPVYQENPAYQYQR